MKKIFGILLISLMLVLISILVLLLSFKAKYTKWEDKFTKDINVENLVNKETISNSYEQKVGDFVLSNSDTEFLELTPFEISEIFFNVLDQYSNENYQLSNVYTLPEKSQWEVCMKVDIKKVSFDPWVCIDLNKDSIQSAQLYSTHINIGPYEIKNTEVVGKINTGIANSLVTVNENGFSGRYLENIELLKENVVVKATRY